MTDKQYCKLLIGTGYVFNSIVVLIPLLAGMVVGYNVGKFRMRREAVEGGHAYYFVNTNHHKEWSWAHRSPDHPDTPPFPYVRGTN